MSAQRLAFRQVVLVSALVLLSDTPSVLAGTGGIFSSSTTARRKIQQIQPIEIPTSLPSRSVVKPTITIPPTPGTVFFDEKKTSKPEGALNADSQMHELQQTLSGTTPASTANGAASTASNTSPVQLRGISNQASVENNQAAGSVESFFQINQPPIPQNSSGKYATQRSSMRQTNSQTAKESAAGAPFRLLWHVMDNAGVPMFFGKDSNDLDPGLRQGYTSAITEKAKASTPAMSGAPAGDNSASSAQTISPHKIPENELEGTDSWVKDNEQMP